MGAAGQGKTETRPKRAGKAAWTGEPIETPAPASGGGQAEKPAETEKEILWQRQPIGTKNRRYGITHAAAYIKILFVFCKCDFHILSIDDCFLFALRTVEGEVS